MVYKTLEIFSVRQFISTKCYYWFYYRIIKEIQVASYSNILWEYLSLLLQRWTYLYLFVSIYLTMVEVLLNIGEYRLSPDLGEILLPYIT